MWLTSILMTRRASRRLRPTQQAARLSRRSEDSLRAYRLLLVGTFLASTSLMLPQMQDGCHLPNYALQSSVLAKSDLVPETKLNLGRRLMGRVLASQISGFLHPGTPV